MTPDSDAESLADLFSINIYENECQTGKSPDKHHYLFTNSDTKIFSLSGYMYIYLDWDKFFFGSKWHEKYSDLTDYIDDREDICI